MVMYRNKFAYFWVLVCVIMSAGLTGCGSHKKVAKTTYTPTSSVPKHVPVSGGMAQPTKKLLVEIDGWLGVPYKYAGVDKNGVDCSALMMNVYNSALGIKLPRNSAKQQEYCSKVSKSDLTPGDLVFFSNSSGRVNHVGMYVGSGNIVHASSSRGVIISSLSDNYYVKNFHSAGRVDQYFAMLKKASKPVDASPVRLDPVNPPEQLQASAPKTPDRPKAPVPVATVSLSELQSVHFSSQTPPAVTSSSIDEARRKVLDEVVEQKVDSILTSFFE